MKWNLIVTVGVKKLPQIAVIKMSPSIMFLGCVLLQIARTYAYAADKELVPVRVLLDSGS